MKKHVIYTSYFEVPKQYLTSSGRLKLSDFAELVSKCRDTAIEDTACVDKMNVEISEVIKVGRNAEPYVKVVVEMEVLAFPHVRKRVLRRFPDQASNYMPKVAFEEVVFRFIRELGYEVSDGVYEGSVPITVQDAFDT